MIPSKLRTELNPLKRQAGFTVLELLIGMVILGILMTAFTQIFGSSLRASSEINARNELVDEGQIAQQLIASRVQSAYYVYPAGTTFSMTSSGITAKNTVRTQNYNWTVGTDPIVALIVPPKIFGLCPTSSSATEDKDACYTFYAYYPVLRSALISQSSASSVPDADPQNASTWVLMEYRTNLLDGVTRSANALAVNCPRTDDKMGYLSCPPDTAALLTNASSVNPNIKGNTARMLVDYVQPLGAAPYASMFTVKAPGAICSDTTSANASAKVAAIAADPNLCDAWVDVNLRMQQTKAGKTLTVPGGTTTLSARIYPRN